MKKIFAALTLTSSLFASDSFLERMKNNPDQDLIMQLAKMPRSSDVRDAAGRYLESLEELTQAVPASVAVAGGAALVSEDFSVGVMGGKNVKDIFDNIFSRDGRSGFNMAIRKFWGISEDIPQADLDTLKRAFIASFKSVCIKEANLVSGRDIKLPFALCFVEVLQKIGIDVSYRVYASSIWISIIFEGKTLAMDLSQQK